MKILIISPSDMCTEPTIAGLEALPDHAVTVFRYDRCGVPVDRHILDAADAAAPDFIVYIGQNGGPFLASESTLRRLRDTAPSAALIFDGADATWMPLLTIYSTNKTFSVLVNIDGVRNWVGTREGLTLLTPVAPHFYRDARPLAERPIKFGFCGGYASPSRAQIIGQLIRESGLTVFPRNERYGSYGRYASFLRSVRIVPNVPFSGSDNAMQVKGRVIEAALAGCCLLEHRDAPTRHWFTPDVDFATYSTSEEAGAEAKHLLANPKDMTAMAANLQRRVMEEHSPASFWAKVFEAASSNGKT